MIDCATDVSRWNLGEVKQQRAHSHADRLYIYRWNNIFVWHSSNCLDSTYMYVLYTLLGTVHMYSTYLGDTFQL